MIIRPHLTAEEKDFLRENYMYMTDDALAEILGVSNGISMRKIRSNMGLKRNRKALKTFAKEVPLVIWVQRELFESESFSNLKNITI